MKKGLVLILVIFGIFSFSSLAMAEGFTVSADYNIMSMDYEGGSEQDLTSLTFDGEYETGSYLVGGSYLTALSYDPNGANYSDNAFCLYAGYKFLDEDVCSLALVGGYTLWNSEVTFNDVVIDYSSELIYVDSFITLMKISSFGFRAKGTINVEPINISALLLYGISNKAEGEASIVISGLELSEESDPIETFPPYISH